MSVGAYLEPNFLRFRSLPPKFAVDIGSSDHLATDFLARCGFFGATPRSRRLVHVRSPATGFVMNLGPCGCLPWCALLGKANIDVPVLHDAQYLSRASSPCSSVTVMSLVPMWVRMTLHRCESMVASAIQCPIAATRTPAV